MRIKKGDNVKIITGSNVGKSSTVIRCIPKKDLIIVENINLKTKRVRPKKSGEKGQTISIAHPIHISNVKLSDESKGKKKTKK